MAIGGATKILLQNELRYPIYKNIKGVAFVDLGTLDREYLQLGELRLSSGLGLRLTLPYFYLSLDFAYPHVKQDEDDTQLVHFKLGTSF